MSIIHFQTTVQSGSAFSLFAGQSGQQAGFVLGGFGSLTPGTLKGETVGVIQTFSASDSLQFRLNSALVSQDFFIRLRVDSLGLNLLSSAAVYSQASGNTDWSWSSPGSFFLNGITYEVVIE